MEALLEEVPIATKQLCRHCGQPCGTQAPIVKGEAFCCQGCATAYALLKEAGLCDYYADQELKVGAPNPLESSAKFDYLQDAEMARAVSDFYTDTHASTTLHIPSIHCSACLYVLENLTKLQEGVLQARVDFVRKEVCIDWNPSIVSLKEIALLLTKLG